MYDGGDLFTEKGLISICVKQGWRRKVTPLRIVYRTALSNKVNRPESASSSASMPTGNTI